MSSTIVRTPALRIIAFPLARPRVERPSTAAPNYGATDAKPKNGPKSALTYYYFMLSSKKGKEVEGGTLKRGMTWATNTVSKTWSSFGKAQEGSWKVRLYQYGERLVDRIDFEELALKGVDPSLGPSVVHPDISGSGVEEKTREMGVIPLLHPPSELSATECLSQLQTLLLHRTPRHRRGFWMWLCISPLTAPFMIIPVIPNLPFFFCAWRAWSHYRAYRASQYLEACLKHGLIVPEAHGELDKVYQRRRGDAESGLMLLDRGMALEAAALTEANEADLLRAVTQAPGRI